MKITLNAHRFAQVVKALSLATDVEGSRLSLDSILVRYQRLGDRARLLLVASDGRIIALWRFNVTPVEGLENETAVAFNANDLRNALTLFGYRYDRGEIVGLNLVTGELSDRDRSVTVEHRSGYTFAPYEAGLNQERGAAPARPVTFWTRYLKRARKVFRVANHGGGQTSIRVDLAGPVDMAIMTSPEARDLLVIVMPMKDEPASHYVDPRAEFLAFPAKPIETREVAE